MDANQRRDFAFQIAANKRHGFFLWTVSGEGVNRKIPPARGQIGVCDMLERSLPGGLRLCVRFCGHKNCLV
jgi:hypothetical protein